MQDTKYLITPFLVGKEYARTHPEGSVIVKSNNYVMKCKGSSEWEMKFIGKDCSVSDSPIEINYDSFSEEDLYLSLDDFSIKMGWM